MENNLDINKFLRHILDVKVFFDYQHLFGMKWRNYIKIPENHIYDYDAEYIKYEFLKNIHNLKIDVDGYVDLLETFINFGIYKNKKQHSLLVTCRASEKYDYQKCDPFINRNVNAFGDYILKLAICRPRKQKSRGHNEWFNNLETMEMWIKIDKYLYDKIGEIDEDVFEKNQYIYL